MKSITRCSLLENQKVDILKGGISERFIIIIIIIITII